MKKNALSLFLLLLAPLFGQVVINEYSAANLYGYVDNYSMEEDWIELFSSGLRFESSKLVVNARSILHHKKNLSINLREG